VSDAGKADFDEAHVPDPEPGEETNRESPDADELYPEPPHPVNWELLTAAEAEIEWLELNGWVDWLRRTYGLTAAVVPPLWHRHPELVRELSALHLHWLASYDPEQTGSAPVRWHHDFAEARQRLRDWVSACGTKLDRDRPTRHAVWPGEKPVPEGGEVLIGDRDQDFVDFVVEDVTRRRAEEEAADLEPGAAMREHVRTRVARAGSWR